MVYFSTDAVQMITLFYNNHICLLKLQRHAILLLQVLLGLDQSLGGLRGEIEILDDNKDFTHSCN